MANDKEKIYKEALKIIKSKNCLFIDQLVSYLPIVRQTFYDYFPLDSDKMDTIKDLIDDNKVRTKHLMQKKWFNSDAPALQTALYKLIGTEEEAHRLNGSKQVLDQKSSDGTMSPVDTSRYTDEEKKLLLKIARNHEPID